MTKLKKIDIIIPLLLFAYSLYYYLEVSALNSDTALLLIKPVFYILAASIVLYIIVQLLSKKESAENQEGEESENTIQLNKTVYFSLSTIIYIMVLGSVGFIVTTLIYTVFLMYVLGVKNLKLLIPIPCILITILYLSLEIWLNIPLPKGVLF